MNLRLTSSRTRIGASLAAATLTVGALAGCSSDSDAEKVGIDVSQVEGLDADNPVTLKIGYTRTFGFLGLLDARNVEIPGVELEFTYFSNPADLNPAHASGAVDLIETGDVAAITQFANGSDARIIATTGPDDVKCGLLVPEDSDAETVADIKGQKVGTLTFTNPYLLLARALDAQGLSTGDVSVVDISGPDATMAFINGDTDVATGLGPNFIDIARQADARPLETCRDHGVRNEYPYVVMPEVAEAKAPALNAVLVAVQDTLDWAHENPEEAAELWTEVNGYAPDILVEYLADAPTTISAVDEEWSGILQATADEVHGLGIIPERVDVKQIVLNDFVELEDAK